jgi:hypothetical protein
LARKLSLSLCPRGKFPRNHTGGGPQGSLATPDGSDPATWRGAKTHSVRQISRFEKSMGAIENRTPHDPRYITDHVAGANTEPVRGD